jgi:hypothetical protein
MARVVFAGALALAVSSSAAAFDSVVAPPDTEWNLHEKLWYSLSIGGASAGTMFTTVERSADEKFWRSAEEMTMSIARGSDKVELWFVTEVDENDKGANSAVGYTQKMARDKVRIDYVFHADHVEVKSAQRGKEQLSKTPLPTQPYMARYAAQQHFWEQAQKGETVIRYATIKPEMGPTVQNITSVLLNKTTLDVLGVPTPCSLWETMVSGISLNTTETFSELDGRLVATLVDSQFGKLEGQLSTEESAHEAVRTEVTAHGLQNR